MLYVPSTVRNVGATVAIAGLLREEVGMVLSSVTRQCFEAGLADGEQ